MSVISITNSVQSASGTYAPDVNRPSAGGNPAEASTVTRSDQANLSSSSSLIAEAVNGSDSDVRSEKVAALQQAIASGTYHVAASDVASKIIDSLLAG